MDSRINNISDIKNVFYINLEHRTDRRAHVESELKKIGLLNFTRMNAIKIIIHTFLSISSNMDGFFAGGGGAIGS